MVSHTTDLPHSIRRLLPARVVIKPGASRLEIFGTRSRVLQSYVSAVPGRVQRPTDKQVKLWAWNGKIDAARERNCGIIVFWFAGPRGRAIPSYLAALQNFGVYLAQTWKPLD